MARLADMDPILDEVLREEVWACANLLHKQPCWKNSCWPPWKCGACRKTRKFDFVAAVADIFFEYKEIEQPCIPDNLVWLAHGMFLACFPEDYIFMFFFRYLEETDLETKIPELMEQAKNR